MEAWNRVIPGLGMQEPGIDSSQKIGQDISLILEGGTARLDDAAQHMQDSPNTLLTRLRYQETVLRISERIATIRDKKELLRLIVQEIQPIFDFHDCGLFIVSRDGQTHQDLATVMPDQSL
jgi:hypothetical protein